MSRQRVLVVDDDELTRQVLRTILNLEEFEVSLATDADEALAVLAEGEPPQIIVLDVMMPGRDGYDLCRELKDSPRTAHVPVILLSARDTDEDRRRGKEAGCDDYLTKPFSPLELIARIGALADVRDGGAAA